LNLFFQTIFAPISSLAIEFDKESIVATFNSYEFSFFLHYSLFSTKLQVSLNEKAVFTYSFFPTPALYSVLFSRANSYLLRYEFVFVNSLFIAPVPVHQIA